MAGQDNVCLVRCQNAARAGPFGGVVPVQLANTTTPAAARRALGRSMRRSEELLVRLMRRAGSIALDLEGLSPDEIADMKEDGDI